MATLEIVGAAEVAEILGIGNTNFSHLRKQKEDTDDAFPDPIVTLKCGPIWKKSDAVKYAKSFQPRRRASSNGADAPKKTKPVAKKKAAKKAVAPAKKKKLSLVR